MIQQPGLNQCSVRFFSPKFITVLLLVLISSSSVECTEGQDRKFEQKLKKQLSLNEQEQGEKQIHQNLKHFSTEETSDNDKTLFNPRVAQESPPQNLTDEEMEKFSQSHQDAHKEDNKDGESKEKIQSQIKFSNIASYRDYLVNFTQEVKRIPKSQIYNATDLSNQKQICAGNRPCDFFYFVIPPEKQNPSHIGQENGGESYNNHTIFIVAGMHGNEFIGPFALLYGLRHLHSGSRLVILPMANPSGFQRRQRDTYPTKIDPNRDYPLEVYQKCYKASSTLIIDHIYRSYQIDLTIGLHNGASQIGWNWGTNTEKKVSHTKEYDILNDIGQTLKYLGGKNQKNQVEPFNAGTMSEVIYPASGTFDDWAYAASWYKVQKTQKTSRGCTYQPYPLNMTKGLVFLIELGPKNVNQSLFGSQKGVYINPESTEDDNGYVSRAIRMLTGVMQVLSPRLETKFTSEFALLHLKGCKRGNVRNFKISSYPNSETIYFEQEDGKTFDLNGSVNNFSVQPLSLKLNTGVYSDGDARSQEIQLHTGKYLEIQYDLLCDENWLGLGDTVFAQERSYKIQFVELLLDKSYPEMQKQQNYFSDYKEAKNSFALVFEANQYQQDHFLDFNKLISRKNDILIGILTFLFIFIACFIVRIICKEMKKQSTKEQKLKNRQFKSEGLEVNKEQSYEWMTENNMEKVKNGSLQGVSVKINNKVDKVKNLSYPHLCESDKSLDIRDCPEQFIQLQQVVSFYQKDKKSRAKDNLQK